MSWPACWALANALLIPNLERHQRISKGFSRLVQNRLIECRVSTIDPSQQHTHDVQFWIESVGHGSNRIANRMDTTLRASGDGSQGMITWSAATSPLMVKLPKLGGQSIKNDIVKRSGRLQTLAQ